jgi:hypothetical protein
MNSKSLIFWSILYNLWLEIKNILLKICKSFYVVHPTYFYFYFQFDVYS